MHRGSILVMATAMGVAISAALTVARRLSDETGLKADFVEGTVYQAPDLTPGPFDLVFTTWSSASRFRPAIATGGWSPSLARKAASTICGPSWATT